VTQTESPQIVWQMNIIGASAYRGYRIPSLYPGVVWQK
jgi:arylsulfate sulfotransferase